MSALNVPNMLSLLRVFLTPLVVIFLTLKISTPVLVLEKLGVQVNYGDLIAGFVFILAAITDTADGYIARKKGIVTNLGKFIDPLADKILVVAALISLVELQRLPAWIVVVIISRDFIVTGIRLVAAVEGIVIAASKMGKIKTVSQIIAITLLIFNFPGGLWAMWIAMILTVWSGMEYLIKGKDILFDAS
ncbi:MULTISPECIES: CDP-diacylglycerol--glycerol-3-phosphate 3-phosphatidyltransferase [Aminobacterium]|jgi:CDP-diacylglycerol--glycerol-3-phosphate 3-phosphatidyltransferase|uniref:CDP-diacylglycerol--glycerol-3-phosphate 3-phosphatidyltransferase n=1 Tax=Aminobacterium TaxID=81466 RepID=UPI000464C8C0|nr:MULTISPECIES: CDP-diacylglycerol--glycerol-3-phosphate 3-phosphatidyltransferase [Aminobacterium]